VKLRELLSNVIQLVAAEMKESGVVVEFDFQNDELQIDLDPELIEMVFINLLKNAREAVNEVQKPKIKLEVFEHDTEKVFVSVVDNGPGIIPEAQQRIFIPFYTTKKHGSGIGLALSKQIMQLHGGTLSVDSRPNDETRFTLTFRK
jgi:signal transduction histidine kinase